MHEQREEQGQRPEHQLFAEHEPGGPFCRRVQIHVRRLCQGKNRQRSNERVGKATSNTWRRTAANMVALLAEFGLHSFG